MKHGIALLALVASASCSTLVAPPVADLRGAPVTVTIDGRSVALHAELWRDFMPVSPPDGKPMAAVVRLVRADDAAPINDLRIEELFVLFGEQLWEPHSLEERLPGSGQDWYEVVARDGPKWGPGVDVDVIVRVRSPGGVSQLLRAAGVRIQRTD